MVRLRLDPHLSIIVFSPANKFEALSDAMYPARVLQVVEVLSARCPEDRLPYLMKAPIFLAGVNMLAPKH